MTEIYYHPLSFPSLAPVFTAEAAGINYTTNLIDLSKGEHKSEEYLAINPYGKVPAMKDGNFAMSESAAIMRYIARANDSSLYPANLKAQAKCDQWIDYVNHHIRANIAKIHFNRSLAPLFGAEPDQKSLDDGLRYLEGNLPAIEQCLSGSPFLCGDAMTLADVALVAALEPIDMSKIDISGFPTLSKWLEARRGEEFYTNVHTHYGAELGM